MQAAADFRGVDFFEFFYAGDNLDQPVWDPRSLSGKTRLDDKGKIAAVRNANANDLADFHPDFRDERLPELLLRYKARNFAKSLSESEREKYEKWRSEKIVREMPNYFREIGFLEFFAKKPDKKTVADFENKLPENEKYQFAQTKKFVDGFTKLGNEIDGLICGCGRKVSLRMTMPETAIFANSFVIFEKSDTILLRTFP